jgi:glycosyltransferase involved in cell wall biosynthesis
VKAQAHEKEIIIVDDGSTDKTAELLQTQKDSNIKIISYMPNRGKGYAIRQALQKAAGDIVIIQDADLEYYPDEYGLLIEKIVQGKADAVYGTRFVGTHRVFYFYHFMGNFILNMIANVILNTTLSDLMTGAKAFRTPVIKSLKLCANRFGIEAEITAEIFRRKYRVYEVPVSYSGRTYEEGKKITWIDFFKCLAWLIRASMRRI